MQMYSSLTTDLGIRFSLTEQVIDANHQLWQRLAQAGAKLKGDETTFPVVFGNQIAQITYQVHRGYTEAGQIDLGGYTLLDAILAGSEHKFWEEVNLPGPLGLWGTAAIVIANDQILLGKKAEKTKDVSAVFAGTWTPPAGIVDVQDLAFRTLKEALIAGALRELREETGLQFNQDDLLSSPTVQVFFEQARCKQQAFVFCHLNGLPNEIPGGTEFEFSDKGFFGFSPEATQALQLLNP